MYPQGSFRNPYYTNPRQQSLGGIRPVPIQSQAQAPKAPEPKREEQQAAKKAEDPARAIVRDIRSDQQPARQPSFQLQPQVPKPQPQPQQLQPQVPKPQPQPQPQQLQPQVPKPQPQPQQLQPQVPKPQPQPQPQPKEDPKKAEQKVPEESSASAPFPEEKIQPVSLSSEADSRAGQMIVPSDNRTLALKGSQPAEQHKSLQQGIREDISNLTHRLSELHGQQKLGSNGDQKMQDLGVRVITLAGENRGAIMDMGSESRKNDVLDVQRVNHKPGGANKNEESPDGNHRQKAAGPVNAFVNSNIQAANNSILYNSTCPHRDPGVRLALSNNPITSKELAPPKEGRGRSVVKAVRLTDKSS
uniref:Uncharacterized protein n=1 Tax=Picea sitchensis TaxID=3332 RepID=A9NVS0_PICSI|nr:unknown [Picea sitchensis]